jgi:hypothetical protein
MGAGGAENKPLLQILRQQHTSVKRLCDITERWLWDAVESAPLSPFLYRFVLCCGISPQPKAVKPSPEAPPKLPPADATGSTR